MRSQHSSIRACLVSNLTRANVRLCSYRLHYNEGQAHADRLANAGAAIGAGVALAVASPTPANVLSGFVAGTLAGLAAHVAGVKRKSRAASAQ